MDNVKSQNHKVLKESKSFDVSTLNVGYVGDNDQTSKLEIFPCPQENADSLFGRRDNNIPGQFSTEKNPCLIPTDTLHQLQLVNKDPR